MKATDISALTALSRPTIHPDGSYAVFATSTPNLEADRNVGQLWRVPLDGSSAPQRITRGVQDGAPQFSPDGSTLAFLRAVADKPQLHIMPTDAGEALQITDAPLGVGSFRWSPDSQRIAFLARVPEEGRYGSVKDLGPSAEAPRRITTLRYRSNGLGYDRDRRNHVFLIEVPDPCGEPPYNAAPSVEHPEPEKVKNVQEARQLTSGDADASCIQFSPDGTRIAFISARHDTRDTDLADAIFELGLETRDLEPYALSTVQQQLSISGFVYSTSGTILFVASALGPDGRDFVAKNGALYTLQRDGSDAVRVTDPENTDLEASADNLVARPGGSVLVLNTWRGSVSLVEISREGEIAPVVTGAIDVHGFDVVADTVVVTFADATTAGDLAVVREVGLDLLSTFSTTLNSAGIASSEEATYPARDGYPVHGWVLTPVGDGPHPVLLNIHGGPYAQYTGSVYDEAQVYVDAGYAVVMCNPRGSAGYGQEHGRTIRHRMGTVDFTDVLDFLDGALAANPSCDPNRVGIMGGSYGGYLTAWTIAHDHRFAAAIVERGYLDPETFVGTSDIGDFFSDGYTGTDPEAIRAQSPQAFVHQVTTPTLVIHSEDDLRCPLSQGERYYAALKRNGVDTELLIFPGENHELSRSGSPRHRVQRFEAILDWWQRYLPVARP